MAATRELWRLEGRDRATLGAVAEVLCDEGRIALALSVGRDEAALARKRDPERDRWNEDAALAAVVGTRVLLAVADAHFGLEASHDLVAALAGAVDTLATLPARPEELIEAVARGPYAASSRSPRSESTLLIAVLDRERRVVRGISFGDSSALLLAPQEPPCRLVERTHAYVSLRERRSLDRRRGRSFERAMRAGELLVVHTDGVDECHYGRAETSVRDEDQAELARLHGARPPSFVRALAELALHGVRGHPGGQDNLAIAATALHGSP